MQSGSMRHPEAGGRHLGYMHVDMCMLSGKGMQYDSSEEGSPPSADSPVTQLSCCRWKARDCTMPAACRKAFRPQALDGHKSRRCCMMGLTVLWNSLFVLPRPHPSLDVPFAGDNSC